MQKETERVQSYFYWFYKNAKEYFLEFAINMATLICGTYIIFHLNYLAHERTTPPIPPTLVYRAYSYIDNWEFAAILILIGLLGLIGVMFQFRTIRKISLILTAPIYSSLAFSFFTRGAFGRINLEWVFILLAFFVVLDLLCRGDPKNVNR